MVLSSPQHSRHSHLKKLGAQNVCYFTSKARGKARNELSRPQPGTPIPPPPGWLISGNGIGIDAVYLQTGSYDISFGATSSGPDPGHPVAGRRDSCGTGLRCVIRAIGRKRTDDRIWRAVTPALFHGRARDAFNAVLVRPVHTDRCAEGKSPSGVN
jgi:hypothetical protein